MRLLAADAKGPAGSQRGWGRNWLLQSLVAVATNLVSAVAGFLCSLAGARCLLTADPCRDPYVHAPACGVWGGVVALWPP